MYRIRLTSGEEAVYRSVEELAVGIQNGVIAPDAEIFHKKSQTWVPIRVHPDYKVALENLPVAVQEPALEVQPEDPSIPEQPVAALTDSTDAPLTIAEVLAAGGRILQMESRSGRELMLRRKNASPWLIAAGGLSAAIIFGALLVLPRQQQASTNEAVKPAEIAPIPTHPAPIPLTPDAGPATTVESLAAARANAAPPPAGPTPEDLAVHRGLSRDTLAGVLEQGLVKLGFTRLFTVTRIGAADSVRITRRAIGPVRTLLNQYRAAVARLDRTYQDSADRLIGGGLWPVGALTNWKAKGVPTESKEEVAISDSLLGTIDRMYGLLLEHEGQFDNSEGSISFNDASVASDYDSLRTVLVHLAAPDSTLRAQLVGAPFDKFAEAATSPVPPPLLLRAPPAPTADSASQH